MMSTWSIENSLKKKKSIPEKYIFQNEVEFQNKKDKAPDH